MIYCVLMRSGVKIWIDKGLADQLKTGLRSGNYKFVDIGDRSVSVSGISGIFTEEDIDNMAKEKSGKWRCKWGNWHARNDNCSCGMTPNAKAKPRKVITGGDKKKLTDGL